MNSPIYSNNAELQTSRVRLLRSFSITALISIGFAAWLLGNVYQKSADKLLLADAKQHHSEIARLYRNFIWPAYGDFLLSFDASNINEIFKHDAYNSLNTGVLREINDSRVLRLKIFNQSGLTVYSSESTQVGKTKNGYAGFESAKKGVISSDFSHREFTSTEEKQHNSQKIYVYSSYVPVYQSNSNEVIAVIEVYSDLSNLVAQSLENKIRLVTASSAIMLLLFVVLLFAVKRADKRMKERELAQQHLQEQANWQANHDALTGLPNRSYFQKLFIDKLKQKEQSNTNIALMFIDLDSFKPINDVHGHQVGDLVLIAVASRIRNALPNNATLARLGGDEFLVICEVENTTATVQSEKILQALSEPLHIQDFEFKLSASIGITYCENNEMAPESYIAEADIAMYKAKRSGQGNALCYDSTKNRAA